MTTPVDRLAVGMTSPASSDAAPLRERTAETPFDAVALERTIGRGSLWPVIGWRRRALVLAAVIGCLAIVTLTRWGAATPWLEATWSAGAEGQLVLKSSPLPTLAARRGETLVGVGVAGQTTLTVDALLLHRWPRWQVDDADRLRQVAQHRALSRLLEGGRPLRLVFAGGDPAEVAVPLRGMAGLGLLFWPLAAVALLLYLFAVVLLLARPVMRNGLYATMALCQAANLLLIGLETTRGLGLPGGLSASDLPVRAALDLCTGAAAVHVYLLHPRRLARSGALAAGTWAAVVLWFVLAWTGSMPSLWWSAQAACIALCAAAFAIAGHSHRREPNPYALVMRRLAAAAGVTLLLATVAVAIAAGVPEAATGVAAGASVAWYLFVASLLLLTPFLARRRQVLREFALLAGVSTIATSLDLLFVAVFSLGTFSSLAVAVFIAVGLYAAARQWVWSHLNGSSLLTTERTFDHLYRAARDVQAQPSRYAGRLAQLLGDLFDPLEVMQVDRVPPHARILGGGAALVIPVHGPESGDDDATSTVPSKPAPPAAAAALVLRFAHRGQRLFTVDDARLADRIVDELRRAVAYDRAVERGRVEERQRLAQDLHDDIGARLLTLMYQAPTREMEDYIRHTLQDLKTLTRGMAVADHRLSHASAEWKSDLGQRLTAAHATLDWQFDVDRDLRLTVVQWSALTRVLRELVSNALYHGHATRIEVRFMLQGPRLELQVTDDGVGSDPQRWAHGLGLGGVRKRVKTLGGEVDWQAHGDRGIVCTVRVARFATPA